MVTERFVVRPGTGRLPTRRPVRVEAILVCGRELLEFSTALSVIDTARRHDLRVHDACYLDLADIRGVGLAPVDVRLAQAGRVAGVPLIAA